MIIQFSETELNHLAIQPVERRERPAAYLEEREQVWAAQMDKVLARGGAMWNGEVYTLEDMVTPGDERVVLRMSTCEYKDLVFRWLKGQAYIARRYGSEQVARFSGVNCMPVTRDGKYVFGLRADRPGPEGPPIGGIAGSLNKDEMEIHSFADIRQCILRELQEETALECPLESLRFFDLYAVDNSYHFRFTIRLPINSEDLQRYHRPGEFSSLVALTRQEALDTTGPMTTDFRYWRPYLHWLPSLLEGGQPVSPRGMGSS